MIYIQEAHPSDGWQLDKNEEDEIVFANPTTLAARSELAQCCVQDLGIEFPALVDDMNNSTDISYAAWPERLYLIGRDGKVVYKSKPGPFGFEPEELAGELETMLPPSDIKSDIK